MKKKEINIEYEMRNEKMIQRMIENKSIPENVKS